MTVGVGDDVAYAATPEQPRAATGWHARFIVAFGGAVVAVCLVLLGSFWSEGLRASTFEELRTTIAEGGVVEWYVADSLHKESLDRLEARQSSLQSEDVSADGAVTSSSTSPTNPVGEPAGGILVWRTYGGPGWHVATADAGITASDGYRAEATDETRELVMQLREAGVSMRPFEWDHGSDLHNVAAIGAFLVFAGLVMGSAPRVGTRWFWFWLFLNGPLAIGFIAYAVMELIGFRRRPDRPLDKRAPGVVGFIGAFVLSGVFAVVAEWLRGRGVPIPL